jgi:PAS domain S-box-containing protein
VWAVDIALGLTPPAVVAATLGRTSDPTSYRPTALLVLAVTALGLVRGRVAAAVGAVASLAVTWWYFTRPFRSIRFEDGQDVAGLVVLAIALAAMWLLVDRVDRTRRKVADAAGLAEALIDEMPVAFALAGPDRRLRRVNQRFADLTGGRRQDLVGGLPSVLHPATGARSEALVQQVFDEGRAVLDTVLEADRPVAGVEHTWRVNHFPVRSGADVVAVGMTMEDITEDVVIRRRAQLLLRLSRRVAGATTAEEIATAVTETLAEGLRARCLFAVVDDDGRAVVAAAAGYHDPEVLDAWTRFHLEPTGTGTLATSLRASELVLASIPADGPAPVGDVEFTVRRSAGDRTVAWQPVVRPGAWASSAAIGVAWPYDRHLTEHSRTLLQTTASISGMAMARVRLTEQTARDRFRQAMDAMLDQVILARSIRDGSGAIVDFEIVFANAAALTSTGRTIEAVVGQRVRELYPGLVGSGLFDRFCQVAETGVPWEEERLAYRDRAADGREASGWWSVQVMQVDDGYLAASRDVTEVVEADRLAREAQEALEREHLAVDLLQRAALPTSLPMLDGVDVGAHYRPAAGIQPVGGDWYDAFLLENGMLALVVADVAGHGQEAAAYMLQVRNIFRAVATEHVRPERVLGQVDRVLQRLNDPGSPFVTCCYATLDLETRELRWALAGHPPPVVAHPDGTAELCTTAPGPPLATLTGSSYEAGSTTLAVGDLLVLYTDGLVERRDELIDDGLTRLATQLRDRPMDLDSEAVAAHLADLVRDPTDDIAILCVSPRGTAGA